MNIKAFTLPELLIVISIMIIATSWSVFYFNDYIDKLKFDWNLVVIESYFDNLDKKVKSKQIYDYELYLETGKWYFYNYKNNIDNIWKQSIENINWIFKIKWENTENVLWQTKIYSDYKYLFGNYMDSIESFTWSFDDYSEYNIIWYMSWSKINDINIKYYSKTNIDKSLNNLFYLNNINTKEDKTGTSYNKVVIQNILWNKIFYSGSINWTIIDKNELFLFIENEWKEQFIKITK